MILRGTSATLVGCAALQLTFNDGVEKTVNVASFLRGPIFEPLLDPAYFSKVQLEQVCGTVVWPNGADFAPEALYAARTVDAVV